MTTTPSLHAQTMNLLCVYPTAADIWGNYRHAYKIGHRDARHAAAELALAADAEIERLTSDRDSWAQQASDRLDDAVTFARERDEAIQERDTLRAELALAREHLVFIERWSNHHSAKPDRTAREALSVIQHYPPISSITKGYADGKMPETRDPWAELAALKSAAPVPAAELTDEEILALARLNTPKGYDCDWWQEDRPLINTVRAALASKGTP